MNIDVLWRDDAHEALGQRAEALCAVILKVLGAGPDTELSVLLTDDEEIRALNLDYRELDEPTDVLSFPLQEGEGAGIHEALGDVVISIPYAERQAATRPWPLDVELGFLLLHGILHLVGYDHEDPEEAAAMEEATARVWPSLYPGVPAPQGFL